MCLIFVEQNTQENFLILNILQFMVHEPWGKVYGNNALNV